MGFIEVKMIAGLSVCFIVGYTAILLLLGKREASLLFKLALSYGLGLGILTHWMLMLGILKVAYGFDVVALPLLVLSGLLVFFRLRKEGSCAQRAGRQKKNFLKVWQEKFSRIGAWEKAVLLISFVYIGGLTYCVFWRALNLPIYAWDAVATSSLKAKVFYFEGSLSPLKNLSHCSYPLHIPLAQTWMALSLEGWDNQLLKIVFPLFFVSFLVIQYYFLKCFMNAKWAVLGTVLVLSSKMFLDSATIALRDFPLMYYNCSAVMMIFLWNKKRDDAYLLLAGLFSGLGTFTKLEGTGYLIIHVFIVLFFLFRQEATVLLEQVKKFLKFALPSLGIYFLFVLYKVSEKLPITERAQFDFAWENLERIPLILAWFGKLVFLSGHWNILWFLLVLSLLNLPRKDLLPEARRVLGLLFICVGFYFLLALCSEVNFISLAGHEAVDVSPRVFLHFFPLAVWAILLLNYSGKSSSRKIDVS